MKSTLSVLFILFLIVAENVKAEEFKEVNSELSAVTVFRQGATLTHKAEVKLLKGVNNLSIINIGDYVNEQSIRVQSDKEITLLSVKLGTNFLENNDKSKEQKKLEDSLEKVQKKISREQNRKNVLGEEENMLRENRKLTGDGNKITVTEIRQMAEYYSARVTEIKNTYLEIDEKIKKLRETQQRLQQQLNSINASKKPRKAIEIKIDADKADKADIFVSYYTTRAKWVPFYDLRIKDTESDLTAEYKASVQNGSGVDWIDMPLTLSTRNPVTNNIAPLVNPIRLNFVENFRNKSGYVSFQNEAYTVKQIRVDGVDVNEMEEEEITSTVGTYGGSNNNGMPPLIYDITENVITSSVYSVEYTTEAKYTVPSDWQERNVLMLRKEIPAKFEYLTVPKYDMKAYLTAKIEDAHKYNLLPGSANIYFENTYAGETYISPVDTKKDLTVSVSPDEGIVVKREMVDDFTDYKFMSSDLERKFGYRTTIKNNKPGKVKITMKSQIPVSMNEDIEVEAINLSGGKLEKDTGIITWELEIESGKSVEKMLVFSVRHPKEKTVNNF